MKKIKKITLVLFTILVHQLLCTAIMAQVPSQFKYQAALRNPDGTIIANESVTVDISILQGSALGTNVLDESHTVTTTAQGLINLNIGSENDMSSIDWSSDTYFIEISVNNTVMGTSQLLSVPYALYAKTVEIANYNELTNLPVLFDGNYNSLTNLPVISFDSDWSSLTGSVPDVSTFANDAGYLISEADGSVSNEIQNLSQVLSENNNADLYYITNLAHPVDDRDAVTKGYVDNKFDLLRVAKNGVTDIDGNHYNGILIGSQVWMAENLKTTHYADGTPIPNVTDKTAWGNLDDNNTDDAYCFYNNDPNSEYGALYTWAAAMGDNAYFMGSSSNPSGVQGACPYGWHLPSDAEWKELEMHLGMSQTDANSIQYRGTNQGSKLATDTSLWAFSGDRLANNTDFDISGFAALPAGKRSDSGSMLGISLYTQWWSTTIGDDSNVSEMAFFRAVKYYRSNIYRNYNEKSKGFSVRCLRDN
ncbi:MAG: hypothetical protein GY756_13080 [bacterium]|nr:hypothetical protein [bacterium]